jgi:hypothetical protein
MRFRTSLYIVGFAERLVLLKSNFPVTPNLFCSCILGSILVISFLPVAYYILQANPLLLLIYKIQTIQNNQTISFPLHLEGYVNGCGWEMNEATAGTVQIFDAKGAAVTRSEPLVYDDTGTQLPRAFIADLHAVAPPSVDTGSLVFISSAGIVKAIPINF